MKENKLKIYLDTSIINFLFADDSPEKKEITVDFFNNFIKKNIYETYISAFVIEEINATQNLNKRNILLDVISNNPIIILKEANIEDVQYLADKYISANIIPKKNIMDAYHVAICVLSNINYLVSWNYRHLANINKENRINIVNKLNHKKDLRIITPLELIDYDESSF